MKLQRDYPEVYKRVPKIPNPKNTYIRKFNEVYVTIEKALRGELFGTDAIVSVDLFSDVVCSIF